MRSNYILNLTIERHYKIQFKLVQYEAKFTELSRFSPQLIATEEENALKFQDGLKPYLKNKISILKLGIYSKIMDKALIAEKCNEKLHQYRE